MRLCAWCGKGLGGHNEGPVSHGICASCFGAALQFQFDFYEELVHPEEASGERSRWTRHSEESETLLVQAQFAF